MQLKIRSLISFLILAIVVFTCYIGCNRDFDQIQAPNCSTCQSNNNEHLFIRSSNSMGANNRDVDENEIGNRKVLLGVKRANPFSVAAMTEAWNSLWPSHSLTALPASHLYVRFKPASLAEYKLLEPSNIHLTTFPLDYEIIQQGDWYDDPAVSNDEMPWFYSVVPANFQFPAVQHEILERLVLAPMKSELTRRSFLIQIQNGGLIGYRDGCSPECESWPECTEEEHIEGCDVIIQTGGHHNPPSQNDPPNDLYGDPIDHNLGHVGTPITNSCGCNVSAEVRNPGGCIKVVDTQLPANSNLTGAPTHLEGVAQAEVIWWDGWFSFHSTHTDDHGCWQITDLTDYGKGYMWVKFKNDRAVIRGLRGARVWEYAFAVTDYIGEIGGPYFNNISVVYTPTGGDGSSTKLFWEAAGFNNALYEYHQFAAQDGIAAPPFDLNILLTNWSVNAATPMLAMTGMDIMQNSSPSAVLAYLLHLPMVPSIPPPPGMPNPVLEFVAQWAPDLIGGYKDNAMISDRMHDIFYHELGHAAHFNALNNKAYWVADVLYILNNYNTGLNPSYGVRGTPGYERCAIIEAWGYHIGPQYADRKYGLFHSIGSSSNPLQIESNRWIYQTEPFRPDIMLSSDLDAFIPKGLFRDLMDNNLLNPVYVTDPIPDPITGFTLANCFNAITIGDPEFMSDVEGNLNTMLPPGVTTTMTRAMFASYGY